jgi:hypothetical protein
MISTFTKIIFFSNSRDQQKQAKNPINFFIIIILFFFLLNFHFKVNKAIKKTNWLVGFIKFQAVCVCLCFFTQIFIIFITFFFLLLFVFNLEGIKFSHEFKLLLSVLLLFFNIIKNIFWRH